MTSILLSVQHVEKQFASVVDVR